MHLVALLILGVVACFLCVAYIKDRGGGTTTEKFRAYYNKIRREEKEIEELRKELRRRDSKR